MLVIVSGGPGTGKTYAVARTLDHVSCHQIRMAPSARIARKIKGRTIHSTFRLSWTIGSVYGALEKKLKSSKVPEGKDEFQYCIQESEVLQNELMLEDYSYRIVVIDEIGMIPFWFTLQIIKYLFDNARKPVMIVMMGDPHQLKPVNSNLNWFNMSSLHFKMIKLIEFKRFDPHYEKVVLDLCRFVENKNSDDMLKFIAECYPVVQEIDGNILRRCDRALAFRKDTVNSYNTFYLYNKIDANVVLLHNSFDKRICFEMKPGCLAFVTQNNCSNDKQIVNGTPVIFKRYDDKKDVIECELVEEDKRVVWISRSRNGNFPIDLGFAATVHKFQGETFDEDVVAINFDGVTDVHFIYTALSRVRSMKQICAIAFN